MTKDEALKLALEYLEASDNYLGSLDHSEPIAAIKEALAQPEPGLLGNVEYIPCCTDQTCQKCKPTQPEQEPVAWRTFDGEGLYFYCAYEDNETYADVWNKRNPNHKGWVEPLYATPPAAHPTQEEIQRLRALVRAQQMTIDKLEEAQPEQEPVAIALNTGTKQGVKWLKNVEHGVNLYTTPPQRTERYTYGTPLLDAFTKPAPVQEPVQVSPLEFVTMVMEKEHLVGKPLFWAEWPNKE